MAESGRRKRNRPMLICSIALVAGILWVYFAAGNNRVILSPVGILLVVGAVLGISGSMRRAVRSQQSGYERPRNTFAERRDLAGGEEKLEFWPYDGSYCAHCGLPVREGDTNCRRCREKLEIRNY